MAISRVRALPRASSRFAMFAQAISSTKPTAPNRSASSVRASSTYASPARCSRTVFPASSGYWRAWSAAIRVDPLLRGGEAEAGRQTPDRRRASATPRSAASAGVSAIGT